MRTQPSASEILRLKIVIAFLLALSLFNDADAKERDARRCAAQLAPATGISVVSAARSSRFIFVAAALEDILAAFNLCNTAPHFKLTNHETGLRKYSGTFDVDDAESLFQLLSHEPELRLRRMGDLVQVWSR